jgi:outer membrane protein OmpA-like peptidoglycan-associated protein
VEPSSIPEVHVKSKTTLTLIAGAMLLNACALNRKGEGAIIGAGAGAVVGGIIGHNTGSTARGAIIGAAVGGATGAIIGHQMDQQAKELQQNIPGARVSRVGEGIAVTFDSGLLFEFDSDRIGSNSGVNLRRLAESLHKYPNTDLVIVGHTDGTGTDAYNQGLSERRARSAADYLGQQGVAGGRMRAMGRGESEPIASNETDDGRQLNRRVEVAIFANAEARKGGK